MLSKVTESIQRTQFLAMILRKGSVVAKLLMVSLQVHIFYCQLRHWNYCPVLQGDTSPVDDAVPDTSVPAFHCRHWDGHKGKTDANKSVAKSKLCPPVPTALPACYQQYKP